MHRVLRNVILILGALGGVFVTGRSGYSLYMERSSTRWPRAGGVVVQSAVRVVQFGRSGTSRTPELRYAYEVEGQRLYSERVVFGWADFGALAPSADSLIAGYAEGAAVQVYYNPRNHNEAVLEPGRYGMALATTAIGLFLLAATFRTYKISKVTVAA